MSVVLLYASCCRIRTAWRFVPADVVAEVVSVSEKPEFGRKRVRSSVLISLNDESLAGRPWLLRMRTYQSQGLLPVLLSQTR